MLCYVMRIYILKPEALLHSYVLLTDSLGESGIILFQFAKFFVRFWLCAPQMLEISTENCRAVTLTGAVLVSLIFLGY